MRTSQKLLSATRILIVLLVLKTGNLKKGLGKGLGEKPGSAVRMPVFISPFLSMT